MQQTTVPTTPAQRRHFIAEYRRNRERSAMILGLPDPEVYYERPIPLRHPFIFYEGHIPAFSFLTLVRNALGAPSIDPGYEVLFQRGIDPASLDAAAQAAPPSWPSREEVRRFTAECDARVLAALETAQLEDPNNPQLIGSEAVYNIIEHEQMHHETLLYMVHQVPLERKRRLRFEHEDRARPPYRQVRIPAGIATLGARRGSIPFGWDNEFEEEQVAVGTFAIDVDSVTNGDYLAYVEAGGDPPPFWRRRDGEWYLLAQFDLLPLPKSWPVFVSHDQAEAYASWKGMRLPTEAEYHRAAFGTPQGDERPFPWGDEPPDASRGNFDFQRYDPVPVGSYPRGASAWGVNDLVGNGWEWTATPFGPLSGFVPMASYPAYSTDFFDGRHYVMKGASPVTDKRLIRRTLRNWFYADYPYMYAKFRCVSV
jgi:iron(II)-dependent oxidoreductase